MEKTIKKTVSFSMIKTILVIMQVDLLRKLYDSKFKIDFNVVISQMKFDLLTEQMKGFIKDTFEDVITKNSDYYNRYCNIVIPDNLKGFDNKVRAKVKRRISMTELKEKKEKGELTENERMIMYSIKLKHLSVRIHNMGKHGKCTEEEARSVISGIQTVFRKAEDVLKKYGRTGEFKLED